MKLSLGKLIGRGRTADVYAAGDGRVVKLFHNSFDETIIQQELRGARAAAEARLSIPQVFGTAAAGKRRGILFERCDGGSLQAALESGSVSLAQGAELMARLHATVHRQTTGKLTPIKERLRARIERVELPDGLCELALKRLRELPEGSSLLHGDMHPGNILLNGDSPVVIDWIDATVGSPAADLARSWVLITQHVPRPEAAPESAEEYQELREICNRFYSLYLNCYCRETGLNPSEVEGWKLPVAVARLREGIPCLYEHLLPVLGQLAADL